MSKIIIGRYIPGNAIVYKMDPRGKILACFLFIIVIFLANNWLTYLILTLFTLAAVVGTGLKAETFWDGVKPFVWLILFTAILQLLFSQGGKAYWHWGILTVSQYGLTSACYIFLRFSMIIIISTVLTVTTTSLQIADGLEWIMTPLKYLRVPVAEIALVLSIALRFVPTLMDETVKITNAQRARGADFNSGTLFERAKSIIPIIIPLFTNSLTVALDLATAMESRGYRENSVRSRYRVLKWTRYDLLNIGYFTLLVVLLIIFRTK